MVKGLLTKCYDANGDHKMKKKPSKSFEYTKKIVWWKKKLNIIYSDKCEHKIQILKWKINCHVFAFELTTFYRNIENQLDFEECSISLVCMS